MQVGGPGGVIGGHEDHRGSLGNSGLTGHYGRSLKRSWSHGQEEGGGNTLQGCHACHKRYNDQSVWKALSQMISAGNNCSLMISVNDAFTPVISVDYYYTNVEDDFETNYQRE